MWVVVNLVVILRLGSTNRRLREHDAHHFVVSAVRQSVAWCTHGLLAHLALVHVTRGLVAVAEGSEACNHTVEERNSLKTGCQLSGDIKGKVSNR